MSYNNILVPYDSSKLSDNALDHAIRIAKIWNYVI
jgi:nucleotide-binding universal stress UspA family protein